MKKLAVVIAFLCVVSFSATNLHARAIGIYGGWGLMQDDYESAKFDDTWTVGVLFDMGHFVFKSLIFRPAFDYLQLDNPDTEKEEIDVYALHLDWYWHFMGTGSFSPFLGFGATLNYMDREGSDNEDSDAGIEGFVGFNYWITHGAAIMLQGRYTMHDIANRDQNIVKVLGGVIFKF